jgi:glycosyltransferase involved in cell wall biosynthesis
MMKILVFCQLFPPLIYGGGEVLLWNLTRALASRGHEVHVITQSVEGEKAAEFRSGVNIVRVGRPVEYSGALTTNLLQSMTYLVYACLAGLRVASRRRINIIHSNTYVPALAGQICALILRRKHVMTVHDVYLIGVPMFWKRWSQQRDIGFLARFFGPVVERLLVRMPVSTIHTVSETSRRDLLQVTPDSRRIVVIPNGVSISDCIPKVEVTSHPHQAIFLGRLVFYKNLEVVFEALGTIVQEIPDAKLVIVGDGPVRSMWERMVNDLKLREHVRFCGRISDEEKLRLLKESAFLVLPSFVEGFGMVVLEAFACGKPALVSSIGALQEVVSDRLDGYLADPTSASQWSDRMLNLFHNPQLAEQMGANGHEKLLTRFGIERVAEEMETLYETALREKP